MPRPPSRTTPTFQLDPWSMKGERGGGGGGERRIREPQQCPLLQLATEYYSQTTGDILSLLLKQRETLNNIPCI